MSDERNGDIGPETEPAATGEAKASDMTPPTAEATAEEKPAEEKPAEVKPAEVKPAEVKPEATTDEKPADEKPAEVKPEATTDEKPADEKPAEVKPETPSAEQTRQDGTDLSLVKRDGPARKVSVRIAGMTDVGRIREHNEDNLLVADLNTRDRDASLFDTTREVGERGLLLAVCDGMGGALAGEIASQMAVDVIHGIVQDAGSAKDGDHFAQKLVGAVQEAGARIYLAAKTNRNQHGMGTTATVAGVFGDQVFVGQVGDSRAYLLRQGRLRQITKDQSLVSKLIEAGQLTEDEAESYEHAHIILQALGTSDAVCVDLSYADLRRGDVLMLCSDGLSGLATNEQIREILASGDDPMRCAQRLTDCANEAGGHDNVTVIVARFDGDLPEPAEDDAIQGYQAHVLSQPVEALVAGRAATSMKVPDLPPPGSDLKHRISLPPDLQSLLPKYDDDDETDAPASPSIRPDARDEDRVAVPMESSPWSRVVLAAVVLGILLGAWLALRNPSAPPEPSPVPSGVVEPPDAAPETPVSPDHEVVPTPLPAPAWGDAAVSEDR